MMALIDSAEQRRVALALATAIVLHALALLLWHTAAGRAAVPLPFRFAAHLRAVPAPSAPPASVGPGKPASPPPRRIVGTTAQVRNIRSETRSPAILPATTVAPATPSPATPGPASPAASEPSGQTLASRAKDMAAALDKENERPRETSAETRKPLEQAIARLFKSGTGTGKVEQLQNGTIRLTHADGSQTCYLLPPAYLGMLSALQIPIAPMNCP